MNIFTVEMAIELLNQISEAQAWIIKVLFESSVEALTQGVSALFTSDNKLVAVLSIIGAVALLVRLVKRNLIDIAKDIIS